MLAFITVNFTKIVIIIAIILFVALMFIFSRIIIENRNYKELVRNIHVCLVSGNTRGATIMSEEKYVKEAVYSTTILGKNVSWKDEEE